MIEEFPLDWAFSALAISWPALSMFYVVCDCGEGASVARTPPSQSWSPLEMCGSVSNEWNAGGEGIVHSSVAVVVGTRLRY